MVWLILNLFNFLQIIAKEKNGVIMRNPHKLIVNIMPSKFYKDLLFKNVLILCKYKYIKIG
jgi:hypothetical protein